MKKLLKETGIRDIKALSDRYSKAEIYFHQDLDGFLHKNRVFIVNK